MEEGYFRKLKPTGLVKVAKEVKDYFDSLPNVQVEFGILSAVLGKQQCEDKVAWLKEQGLQNFTVNFVPYGTNKAVVTNDTDINILIDDLSKNLIEFCDKPNNYGIKYYNSINGTKGTWEKFGGESLSYKEQNTYVTLQHGHKELSICALHLINFIINQATKNT